MSLSQKKDHRFVFNLANGVTVTARKQSSSKSRETGREAYYRARSALLANEKRALERAIASGVLASIARAETPQTAANTIALQQQLTDATITASTLPILQKQMDQYGARLRLIEKRWEEVKRQANAALQTIATKRLAASKQLTNTLKTAKSPAERSAILALAANAKLQFDALNNQIRSRVQEKNTQLSNEMNEAERALLGMRREFEEAKQANNTAIAIQRQLQSSAQSPIPIPTAKRTRQKPRRKGSTPRRRAVVPKRRR